MRTFEWAIEDIIDAYPLLGLDDYAAMAVALLRREPPPCEFLVQIQGFTIDDLESEDQFNLNVTWNPRTRARAERLERTKQRASIVEGAAVAMTALLISHLIKDSDWGVTLRGDGPDYWLPRLKHALEITGTERFAELARRRREKKRQVLGNARGWDGYVVLCCFAEPRRLIQWIHYSQQEES